jgi:hypothetical protein
MVCDGLVIILLTDVKDGEKKYSQVKGCTGGIDIVCPKSRLPNNITEDCHKRKPGQERIVPAPDAPAGDMDAP